MLTLAWSNGPCRSPDRNQVGPVGAGDPRGGVSYCLTFRMLFKVRGGASGPLRSGPTGLHWGAFSHH